MRLSNLSLAAVLLLSSVAFAQHGGGGGGGGGGSHGGSSGGGGGSSGGSHSSAGSSGGSSSHGSSGHGSTSHGSSSSSTSHSSSKVHSNVAGPVHGPHFGTKTQHESLAKAQPERRGHFSFLRHPFRKHHPEPVADLRRHLCLTGACSACPTGQARVGGACTTPRIIYNNRNVCSHWDIWVGDPCLANTRFVDDCASLRTMLQQQAQRMDAAEIDRQTSCSAGAPDCSSMASRSQSEASLYRELRARYAHCRQGPGAVSPFGDAFVSDTRGLRFEPR